jgi:hypothetical protein
MPLPTSEHIFNKDFCKGTTPKILDSIRNYRSNLVSDDEIKIYDFQAMRNFNTNGLFIDLTQNNYQFIPNQDPIYNNPVEEGVDEKDREMIIFVDDKKFENKNIKTLENIETLETLSLYE